jgi:two-component system, NarL family, sensor kinase
MFTVVPEAFLRTDGWLWGLIVAFAGYAVTGVVLWLASATVLRHRCARPVPIPLVVAVGALAWGARSGVIVAFLALTQAPSQAPAWQRLLAGMALGAVLVPASAWALAVVDSFRQERSRLLDELVAQEVRAERLAIYLDVLQAAILAEVRQGVSREFDRVADGRSLADVATFVDDLTVRLARDIPRTLWTEARRQFSLSARDVLAMVGRKPMAMWPVVPLWILGVLVVSRSLGWVPAAVFMLAPVAWTVMVVAVVNRLAAAIQRGRLAVYVAALLLVATSGPVFVAAVTAAAGSEAPVGVLGLLVSVSFVLFVAGAGLGSAVNVTETEVLQHLRASISDAEVRTLAADREEARLRRELATALHGSVAASLTAAAMRLRHTIDAGDADASIHALFEARRLVNLQLVSLTLAREGDLDTLLHRICESWSGLVEITYQIAAPGNVGERDVRLIDDVVTEGVNNAVRHGNARHVHVAVARDASGFSVTVVDDGVFVGGRRAGLGSQILDLCADGGWSLHARVGGGSELHALLGVRPTRD